MSLPIHWRLRMYRLVIHLLKKLFLLIKLWDITRKSWTTLIESIKATSDEDTLTTPRKTRKHNMKTLQELLSKKRATDQEHCTSQITGEVASGSACFHVKDNSVSVHNKRISSNGNMWLGSPTGELKERTNQNGAVLVSDQQHPLRSSDLSEASQNAKRKRESSKEEQILLHKEHVTILTRGLPETVVAKWDGEASASKKMGKSEGTRIGYVADEC